MSPTKSIRIPVQPISGAEPLMCWHNVQKRIKAMGGRAVFGWTIRHDLYTDIKQNHCVWEDRAGQLWDVTSVFTSVQDQMVIIDWPEDTQFERDETAAFEGMSLQLDTSLPTPALMSPRPASTWREPTNSCATATLTAAATGPSGRTGR